MPMPMRVLTAMPMRVRRPMRREPISMTTPPRMVRPTEPSRPRTRRSTTR
jgi:hypothetical protein